MKYRGKAEKSGSDVNVERISDVLSVSGCERALCDPEVAYKKRSNRRLYFAYCIIALHRTPCTGGIEFGLMGLMWYSS